MIFFRLTIYVGCFLVSCDSYEIFPLMIRCSIRLYLQFWWTQTKQESGNIGYKRWTQTKLESGNIGYKRWTQTKQESGNIGYKRWTQTKQESILVLFVFIICTLCCQILVLFVFNICTLCYQILVLFAYCGVHHILCCIFVLFSSSCVPCVVVAMVM
jgi:hypothetical protein